MMSRNCTVQSCLHAETQWLFFSTFLLLLDCLTRGINSSNQSQALLECLTAAFLVSFQSFQQTVCFSHMGILHFTCLKQGQFCKLGFCQIVTQSSISTDFAQSFLWCFELGNHHGQLVLQFVEVGGQCPWGGEFLPREQNFQFKQGGSNSQLKVENKSLCMNCQREAGNSGCFPSNLLELEIQRMLVHLIT